MLYLLTLLALGLLISAIGSTQRQAFANNFLVLNPFAGIENQPRPDTLSNIKDPSVQPW